MKYLGYKADLGPTRVESSTQKCLRLRVAYLAELSDESCEVALEASDLSESRGCRLRLLILGICLLDLVIKLIELITFVCVDHTSVDPEFEGRGDSDA